MPLLVILSILLEQIVWCPFVYCLWDIPVEELQQGSSTKELLPAIKTKLPPLLVENANCGHSQIFWFTIYHSSGE
jgi:hypothetical protein